MGSGALSGAANSAAGGLVSHFTGGHGESRQEAAPGTLAQETNPVFNR
ncbi:hypothetical protein [Streptomyces sp. BH105]